MSEERGLTLAEVLFGLGVVGVILLLLLVALARRPTIGVTRTPTSSCISNMHNIGTGLTMYQADFGTWPSQVSNEARLGFIRALYVDSDEMFQCPAVPTHKTSFDATKKLIIGSDYHLEGPIPANAGPMRATAGDYNKDGMNHGGKRNAGSVIMFYDTHVVYVKQDAQGKHPNKYIAIDKDIYAIDTQPRDKDDADLD